MNKIDQIMMTGCRQLTYHFNKLLYYFMFRNYKNCKSFCLTCKDFDACLESTKKAYKELHKK